MTTLREAAQQALEALEGGSDSWQRVGPAIDALKEALADGDNLSPGEPVQEHEDWCASVTQLLLCHPPRKAPCNCKKKLAEPLQDGCDHCNHPLYAAIKCKVCGRGQA